MFDFLGGGGVLLFVVVFIAVAVAVEDVVVIVLALVLAHRVDADASYAGIVGAAVGIDSVAVG